MASLVRFRLQRPRSGDGGGEARLTLSAELMRLRGLLRSPSKFDKHEVVKEDE